MKINISRRKLSIFLLMIPIISSCFIFSNFVDQQIPIYTDSNQSSFWISCADKAWRFFEVNAAVHPNTGLCGASLLQNWPYFTEWDLGTYIFAILDAERVGVLSRDGPWGSTERLNKILSFLQNREIAPNGVSYLWYDARTGNPAKNISNETTNVSDLGFLLIALHTLKTLKQEYSSTIDYIVNQKENMTKLASDTNAWRTTSGIYKWYVAHGFKIFGFDQYAPVKEALNTLNRIMDGPEITTYNVTFPVTSITSEPIILAMFTLEPEPYMKKLVLKTYLAQQNRYYMTGRFTGFSEGNTGLPEPFISYVYEWIVTGSGETWKVTPADIVPIIYTKVGFGFYSLFRTQYALDLINHVNSSFKDFTYGYKDGIDEYGRVVDTIIDRTNGIILASARYALKNLEPYSLENYPNPFVDSSNNLNVTFIIGDTNHHPPYNWQAYTLDLMGTLGLTGKLGQLSSSGYVHGVIDTWISEWNSTDKTVNIDWEKIGCTNVISIGGPPVNMFAYYYEQMAATPFHQCWDNETPYIRSDLTGESYFFNWGINDYAVLSIFYDRGRVILLGWGLTHRGTVAICQFLQYFDSYYVELLSGRAVLIKWVDQNGDADVDLNDEISIVEVWP